MPGPTRIDGLGAGIVPEVLNVDIIDDVITVSEEVAYQTMKDISKNEGLLVGMSSGANGTCSIAGSQSTGTR